MPRTDLEAEAKMYERIAKAKQLKEIRRSLVKYLRKTKEARNGK